MSGSITAWLNLLRDGSELAAEKLWQHFAPDLQGRIAQDCRPLKICDAEDVVVTAFYRLVNVMQEKPNYPVTDRVEFWKFLVVISKRVIGDWRKYDNATCRGGEVQILPFNNETHQKLAERLQRFELFNEVEIIAQLEELASKMDRPECLRVIELKQQGLTIDEIAREIGYSPRTVSYIIRDIRIAWQSTFEQKQAA
ncbi:MAG: ECF-type sigma factor [Planctomycetota bacterium]